MRALSLRWLLATSALMMALAGAMANAQETKPDTKPAPEAAADRYQVPDGDVAALTKFIEDLLGYRPTSREDAQQHMSKVLPAVKTATQRIMTLETDKESNAYRQARSLAFKVRLNELQPPRGDQAGPGKELLAKARQQLVKEILAAVAETKSPGPLEADIVGSGTEAMEAFGESELAATLCEQGSKLLAASSDEQVKAFAESLSSMARRMSLPGKEMVVSGTRLDGTKLDIKSLRGKVVLVDFWATWCGPCIGEIPNMKKNYEAYHEKGFEIVGISLDQDREALEAFVKENELPWVILHEKEAQGNPVADFYAINAIPAMFLIGKDGKVISTQARGEELNRLLEAQFGAAPKPDDAK